MKAVLFDFDGTLAFLPTDYPGMRERLSRLFSRYGVNSDFRPIVDSVNSCLGQLRPRLPGAQWQSVCEEAHRIMESEELSAAASADVAAGAGETLEWLKGEGVKVVVVTRNGGRCVNEVFARFGLPSPDLVVSRDDVRNVKPHREHGEVALAELNLQPEECVVVGDSWHDVELGERLGVPVVLLSHGGESDGQPAQRSTAVIGCLSELRSVMEDVQQ